MDNLQATTRLEERLKALCNSKASVCQFTRFTGAFSDNCVSGNANVGGPPFKEYPGKMHSLPRANFRNHGWVDSRVVNLCYRYAACSSDLDSSAGHRGKAAYNTITRIICTSGT